MRAAQVIDELLASPLIDLEEAEALAPPRPGVYAWWCESGALPGGVPAPPHPVEDHALLYVGVAPGRPGSAGTLRTRLRRHTSADIGSSTFRLSLTALLWEEQGWRLTWTDRPALRRESRAALGAWQHRHLAVRWCVCEEPWSIEAEVISSMSPPLNREHGGRNPFHTTLGVARNDLRRAARLAGGGT